MGKTQSLSNFIENTSLCLKCSLFKFVNAKLEEIPLASFSAICPHLSASHFLGAGGILLQAEDGCRVLSL